MRPERAHPQCQGAQDGRHDERHDDDSRERRRARRRVERPSVSFETRGGRARTPLVDRVLRDEHVVESRRAAGVHVHVQRARRQKRRLEDLEGAVQHRDVVAQAGQNERALGALAWMVAPLRDPHLRVVGRVDARKGSRRQVHRRLARVQEDGVDPGRVALERDGRPRAPRARHVSRRRRLPRDERRSRRAGEEGGELVPLALRKEHLRDVKVHLELGHALDQRDAETLDGVAAKRAGHGDVAAVLVEPRLVVDARDVEARARAARHLEERHVHRLVEHERVALQSQRHAATGSPNDGFGARVVASARGGVDDVHADVGRVLLDVLAPRRAVVAAVDDGVARPDGAHVSRVRVELAVPEVAKQVREQRRDVEHVDDAVAVRPVVAPRRLAEELRARRVGGGLHLEDDEVVRDGRRVRDALVEGVSERARRAHVETEQKGLPSRVAPEGVVGVGRRRLVGVVLHERELDREEPVRAGDELVAVAVARRREVERARHPRRRLGAVALRRVSIGHGRQQNGRLRRGWKRDGGRGARVLAEGRARRASRRAVGRVGAGGAMMHAREQDALGVLVVGEVRAPRHDDAPVRALSARQVARLDRQRDGVVALASTEVEECDKMKRLAHRG